MLKQVEKTLSDTHPDAVACRLQLWLALPTPVLWERERVGHDSPQAREPCSLEKEYLLYVQRAAHVNHACRLTCEDEMEIANCLDSRKPVVQMRLFALQKTRAICAVMRQLSEGGMVSDFSGAPRVALAANANPVQLLEAGEQRADLSAVGYFSAAVAADEVTLADDVFWQALKHDQSFADESSVLQMKSKTQLGHLVGPSQGVVSTKHDVAIERAASAALPWQTPFSEIKSTRLTYLPPCGEKMFYVQQITEHKSLNQESTWPQTLTYERPRAAHMRGARLPWLVNRCVADTVMSSEHRLGMVFQLDLLAGSLRVSVEVALNDEFERSGSGREAMLVEMSRSDASLFETRALGSLLSQWACLRDFDDNAEKPSSPHASPHLLLAGINALLLQVQRCREKLAKLQGLVSKDPIALLPIADAAFLSKAESVLAKAVSGLYFPLPPDLSIEKLAKEI